ncbi:MAG: hypothetical protein OXU20_01940 [Myxococcales bacterium]|nr:hypothetical protein [Myxococcales bacterium]
MSVQLAIGRLWDGSPLPHDARGVLSLTDTPSGDILVQVDTKAFGDPIPPAPAGSFARLWEYEVVELFLAGHRSEYLEVELGPAGHYLVLMLAGIRMPVRSELPLDYHARLEHGRFRGKARIPAQYLPAGPLRANAYAIHRHPCCQPVVPGSTDPPPTRCYHAHAAVPGPKPDFHQPDHFVPIDLFDD